MFLKCLYCTNPRNIFQVSALRTIKTSAGHFSSDRNKHGPPKKQSFFNALKEHREKNMTINEIPVKESISTMLKVQQVSQDIPKDFKTVYKFPAVKYFSLVNRLKVYQTVLTIITGIGSTTLWACGILSSEFIILSTGLGIAGCLTLYSLGYVAARFVGFIYYNEKTRMVRIAYVDFWGRRRDIELLENDIVRCADSPEGLVNKIWFPLRRYSTNETLKLQLNQGVILDEKALKNIL